MKITKTSTLSGKTRTREIDCTQEQINAWIGGELIQRAMPHLSDDDREFIMTGITQEEWDEEFGDDEDDFDEFNDEEAF